MTASTTMWAVIVPGRNRGRDYVIPGTVKRTRAEAIEAYCEPWMGRADTLWRRERRRRGVRAAKVSVEEVSG